jgi:HK97 family phage major capsid protein
MKTKKKKFLLSLSNIQYFNGGTSLTDLQTEMQKAFGELKQMGQRQDDEIKKFGAPLEETKNSIAAINTEMDKLKAQIDDLATKANRMPGSNGNTVDPKDQEKKDIFFKFMKQGLGSLSREEKALVQDATGDILVPADIDKEIQRALPQLNVIRQLASVRGTKSDRVRRVNMNELTVGWGKVELATKPDLDTYESTLTPAEAFAYVEDAYGLTKIGEDELEDSEVNLTQYISDSFSDAYANLEETGFLLGTGHANNQPEGILNGSVVTRFQTGAIGTMTADDLIKLAYEVPASARKNGTYLVNGKIEMSMRLMKDSQGQYLWQPSLQAGAPTVFNGFAVHNAEPLSNSVAAGNNVAVFGDLKRGYQILDRREGYITRINELYINEGLIGFRYKRRVGGYVKNANALRVLQVRTT